MGKQLSNSLPIYISNGNSMQLFSESFRKEHMLSKIDARVKLIVTLALLAMVLSSEGIFFPLFIASLCLFLCLRMRVPLPVMRIRFSEPLFIAAVLLLLKFFFSGEDVFFSINIIGIKVVGHKDGLMEGLRISSRIIGAVSLIAVIGFATPFTEFIAGLSWLRIPRQFVELLMLTYRYIFVLLEDANVIYNAQKNRLGYSGIRRGLSSFGTLSGELTLRAFDHSQKTALAMAQRGYTGEIPIALNTPFKIVEVIMAILVIATIGALWKIQ
jgi:cobalt/nickel transport system permease protein